MQPDGGGLRLPRITKYLVLSNEFCQPQPKGRQVRYGYLKEGALDCKISSFNTLKSPLVN